MRADPGARAEDEPVLPEAETWTASLQSTYVWQAKPAINSAYAGANSLLAQREKSYSFTATAFLGARAWEGGELYFNPEIVRGVPLSNLAGQPGKLRALVFRNTAFMGGFDDALAYAAANGGTPTLSNVRQEQTKVGVGLSLEQALGENAGLFERFSQSDGKSETYAFTEIDCSLSAGVVLQGSSWGRARTATISLPAA